MIQIIWLNDHTYWWQCLVLRRISIACMLSWLLCRGMNVVVGLLECIWVLMDMIRRGQLWEVLVRSIEHNLVMVMMY